MNKQLIFAGLVIVGLCAVQVMAESMTESDMKHDGEKPAEKLVTPKRVDSALKKTDELSADETVFFQTSVLPEGPSPTTAPVKKDKKKDSKKKKN